MNGQVIYNIEDLQEVATSFNAALEKVTEGLKDPLDNKFEVLEQLQFFTEGLGVLREDCQIIYNAYKSLIAKLNAHGDEITDTESELVNYVNRNRVTSSAGEKSGGNGQQMQYDNILTDDVNKGLSINTDTIEELVGEFDSTVEEQILEAWKKEGTNVVNSMLLSDKNSGILLLFLKNILGEENIGEIEVSDDTKRIQKALLEGFVNNNVLDDFKDDSIFAGLAYFKQVALENNIKVSDLLLDDDYNDLFLSAVKDLYEGNVIIEMPKENLDSFKKYLDDLCLSLKIDPSELTASTKYIEFIKQGVQE